MRSRSRHPRSPGCEHRGHSRIHLLERKRQVARFTLQTNTKRVGWLLESVVRNFVNILFSDIIVRIH